MLSGKCFVVIYVFSFPPGVYVGTFDLIASIPGPFILTLIMRVICLPCQLKTPRKKEKHNKCTVSLLTLYLCYFLSILNSVKCILHGTYQCAFNNT